MIELLGWVAILFAALPAALAVANLRALKPPAAVVADQDLLVSILIPARNEAGQIDGALVAARASEGVAVEIVVMDDGSTDDTARLVQAHAAVDPRVRLEKAPPLPSGWAGKTHACHRLAAAARGTHLLFVDADVRLTPDAAARLAMHARTGGFALVSGVPRQVMQGLGEFLTVPMINLLLIGYLPIARMRRTLDPALGAACGQLLLVDAAAYRAAGGHAAIRHRLHDALMLVRHLRARGHKTDLVAGATLAECRMYEGLRPALLGFLKNAHEGMARPVALPVWTVLLGCGHLLPPVLLTAALAGAGPLGPPLIACGLSFGLRAAVTAATRENLWSVPLHPATVLVALGIQWTALLRARRGRPTVWKGRAYPAG